MIIALFAQPTQTISQEYAVPAWKDTLLLEMALQAPFHAYQTFFIAALIQSTTLLINSGNAHPVIMGTIGTGKTSSAHPAEFLTVKHAHFVRVKMKSSAIHAHLDFI